MSDEESEGTLISVSKGVRQRLREFGGKGTVGKAKTYDEIITELLEIAKEKQKA